jgi:hypothetical protein
VDKTLASPGPGQGPVSSRPIHQQGSRLCDPAGAQLGESGTNHLRGSDSDFVNVH